AVSRIAYLYLVAFRGPQYAQSQHRQSTLIKRRFLSSDTALTVHFPQCLPRPTGALQNTLSYVLLLRLICTSTREETRCVAALRSISSLAALATLRAPLSDSRPLLC